MKPILDAPAGVGSKGYATFLPECSSFVLHVLVCCYTSPPRDLREQTWGLLSLTGALCAGPRRRHMVRSIHQIHDWASQQVQKTNSSNSPQRPPWAKFIKQHHSCWPHTTSASLADHKSPVPWNTRIISQTWKWKCVFHYQVDSSPCPLPSM